MDIDLNEEIGDFSSDGFESDNENLGDDTIDANQRYINELFGFDEDPLLDDNLGRPLGGDEADQYDGQYSDDLNAEGEQMDDDELETRDQNRDDQSSGDDEFEITEGNGTVVPPPYKNQIFESCEELKAYWGRYGKAVGFPVKTRSFEKQKSGARTENGQTTYSYYYRIRLTCSLEGKFESKSRNPKNAPSSCRVGCPVTLNAVQNLEDGTWKVTYVKLDHNHPVNPKNSSFFPRYRSINMYDRQLLLQNDRAGVPPAKNYTAAVIRHGGFEGVPFSEKDARNLIQEERRLHLKEGDFTAMREFFNKMEATRTNFFYSFDTTKDGTLRNVFWADGRSIAACKDFGDVLSFDSTYVKNRYKMPFAPFIGVNNHGQSILLGCGLLGGEEIENYVWLFETWLRCMGGKAPKAILSDQCKSIGGAIQKVFPNTVHRWCLWHVLKNGLLHLKQHPECKALMIELKNVLYDSLSIEEFEEAWLAWRDKYGVRDNSWVKTMFQQRRRWVPVYFKDTFFAGMSTTQRSESMNHFFKGFVNINTTLKQFVEQYNLALGKRVKEEDRLGFTSSHSPLMCCSDNVIEAVFQRVYTTNKFKEFQREVRGMIHCNVTKLEETTSSRKYGVVVRRPYFGKFKCSTYEVTVETSSMDLKCECKKFEFRGILCSHCLCVFREEECTYLPERYVLRRWRKDVPWEHLKVPVPYYSGISYPKEMERYMELQKLFEPLASACMVDPELFKQVSKAVADLVTKSGAVITGNGLLHGTAHDMGRVYGRRTGQRVSNTVTTDPPGDGEQVKDPVDRRGRGRMAARRKGHNPNERRRGRGAPYNIVIGSTPPRAYQPSIHQWLNMSRPVQGLPNYGFGVNTMASPPFCVVSGSQPNSIPQSPLSQQSSHLNSSYSQFQ